MRRRLGLVAFALAALFVGILIGARLIARSDAARAARAMPYPASSDPRRVTTELRVPHLKAAIVLDGDMDDPGWEGVIARTGPLLASNGTPARPYSDARMVWGDGHLYLALYAADEDVRAEKREPDAPVWLDDSFHLVFSSEGAESTLDVSAFGVITDARTTSGGSLDYAWASGAHVSRELDGTLNDSTDEDEEWALELTVPLDSIGLEGKRGERIGFSVRRCDTPKKGGKRVCASWGDGETRGVIVLD
jgi:hypothetical protein